MGQENTVRCNRKMVTSCTGYMTQAFNSISDSNLQASPISSTTTQMNLYAPNTKVCTEYFHDSVLFLNSNFYLKKYESINNYIIY